ncbi:MAG TPA: circularly permuted type 2 ATP-grasp protein, partial [Stellaceae bacterium]|nr:circularly permuted type 2 ATP-grasp protein [Stellaceae bacterium]
MEPRVEDAATLPKTYAQAFDETGLPGECLPQYRQVKVWLDKMPRDFLMSKRREAEFLFRRTGITFAVYNDGGDPERLIPFDIIPRVLAPAEWTVLQRGLMQRVKALNAFIHDVYHEREIFHAGKIPAALILHNEAFRPEMQGFSPPHNVYAHVSGIDMVRVGPSDFYVLEDNCRTPSGVSYMLENREAMMRLFPDLYSRHRIAPVSHYPEELHDTLRSVAPENCEGEPTIVLLTPG